MMLAKDINQLYVETMSLDVLSTVLSTLDAPRLRVLEVALSSKPNAVVGYCDDLSERLTLPALERVEVSATVHNRAQADAVASAFAGYACRRILVSSIALS
jgi:hypothetical protein